MREWGYAMWPGAAVWGYSMQFAMAVPMPADTQYYEPFGSTSPAVSSTDALAACSTTDRWADICDDGDLLPPVVYPDWHPERTRAAGDNHGRAMTLDSLPENEWTTVIFRNVPSGWTRNSLTQLLDDEGFSGHYDFVHVPVKFADLTNLGYALVNLVCHSAAAGVRDYFQGFEARSATLETGWSQPNQGLVAHVERYRDSPMMHRSVPEQYQPGLYRDGARIAFPAPTKPLRAPRVRRQKTEEAR